jgi:hypothetical protein
LPFEIGDFAEPGGLRVCLHNVSREYWGALGIRSSIDRERCTGNLTPVLTGKICDHRSDIIRLAIIRRVSGLSLATLPYYSISGSLSAKTIHFRNTRFIAEDYSRRIYRWLPAVSRPESFVLLESSLSSALPVSANCENFIYDL